MKLGSPSWSQMQRILQLYSLQKTPLISAPSARLLFPRFIYFLFCLRPGDACLGVGVNEGATTVTVAHRESKLFVEQQESLRPEKMAWSRITSFDSFVYLLES